MELEEAEKWFQSEEFQNRYAVYTAERIETDKRIADSQAERERKQAEYEASPQYAIDQAAKKARLERDMLFRSIKGEVLQAIHDALVRSGATCEDYDDDDYRCC